MEVLKISISLAEKLNNKNQSVVNFLNKKLKI